MTVAELINKLSELDPDVQVYVPDTSCCGCSAEDVVGELEVGKLGVSLYPSW